jgi:hypothetical protein
MQEMKWSSLAVEATWMMSFVICVNKVTMKNPEKFQTQKTVGVSVPEVHVKRTPNVTI